MRSKGSEAGEHSQSHLRGIETDSENLQCGNQIASQSHLRGIETQERLEQMNMILYSQSHLRGIET